MRAAAVLIGIVAAGCNSILGIGDVHSSATDAAIDGRPAPDAAPPPVCPSAGPGEIVGCYGVTHLVTGGGTQVVATDLSQFTIQAYVLDQAGAFSVVDGVVTGPGVFTIAVPDAATYYVKLLDTSNPAAVPSFYATTQRDLDFGYVTLARPTAAPVTRPTTITINIDGMTAWKPDDYLLVDSFTADTENFIGFPAAPTGAPAIGATAVAIGFDWQGSYAFGPDAPPKLLDAAAGDDFWFTHNTSMIVDVAGYPIVTQWIADYYTSSGAVTMTDGAPVTVPSSGTATFTKLTPTLGQVYSVNVGALRGVIPDGNHYFAEDMNCALLQNPAVTYGDGIGPAVAGFNGTVSPKVNNVTLAPIQYATFYPASWQTLIVCGMNHYRRYLSPGATQPKGRPETVGAWQAAATPFTFAPTAGLGHAPGNVKVGGALVQNGGTVAFDGTTPVTVSWDPVPGADSYRIRIVHAGLDVKRTTLTTVATISTASTSIRIPADLLVEGDFYELEVSELTQTGHQFASGHLQQTGAPYSYGTVLTGLLRFSNKCGDHAIDAATGEECDDAGDSATCDADCTHSMCGDGYVNAAANEECDDVVESPHCDQDCTLVVCGDGYFNGAAGEQCDDGNTADGDGCSHDCVLEHCGDGAFDPNLEGCDDGNTKNGDGCSAFCQVDFGWTCTLASPSVCTRS